MNKEFFLKVFSFGCVGVVGFAVDAGILSLLVQGAGVNVYLARMVSFLVAVFATWLLNRTWVFKRARGPENGKKREYTTYLLVQVCGALINLGVFSALISLHPTLKMQPVIPLAAGSFAAMFFNFTGSQFWVFRQGHRQKDGQLDPFARSNKGEE